MTANQNINWSCACQRQHGRQRERRGFCERWFWPGTVNFTQAGNNTYTGGTYVDTGTLTTGSTANRRYLGTGKVTREQCHPHSRFVWRDTSTANR